ncbi:MAG: CpsD/CapB family tyrosine-protein kinase [Alphaproteobacteria bacterium]|nr:CpsD/CapB family tyrosine-protein kinase [Alphaproteobacteria bacterium]
MERIKEAIERARNGQFLPSTDNRDSVQTESSVARQPNADLQNIVYDQTRVVDLDPHHLEANRIIAVKKTDPRSMSFDILRTKVLKEMTANGWRTLGITSPKPECGKSVVAINLAISLSRQTDYSVLLADFDLRKPRLGAYLGLPREDALLDCIEGRRAVQDAMINPGIPRLIVLANSSGVTNASELLTSQNVRDLVIEFRERYDNRILIFDLPPVLTADDTLAFLPQLDCALLVAASGVSTKSDVEESQRLLSSSNLLGVALNKADDHQESYY